MENCGDSHLQGCFNCKKIRFFEAKINVWYGNSIKNKNKFSEKYSVDIECQGTRTCNRIQEKTKANIRILNMKQKIL